jgi:uncharacterized membrane protein
MTVLTMIAFGVTLALTGLVTGVYFTFSNSVLPGLDTLPPEQAYAAIRGINEKILNPPFLATFVGTPLAAIVTAILLLAGGDSAAAWWLFAAAAVYVAGAFVPTAAVNVPLNNTLARPAEPADAARLWTAFAPRWTRWNNLRVVASTISLLLTGIAVYVWGA